MCVVWRVNDGKFENLQRIRTNGEKAKVIQSDKTAKSKMHYGCCCCCCSVAKLNKITNNPRPRLHGRKRYFVPRKKKTNPNKKDLHVYTQRIYLMWLLPGHGSKFSDEMNSKSTRISLVAAVVFFFFFLFWSLLIHFFMFERFRGIYYVAFAFLNFEIQEILSEEQKSVVLLKKWN